MEFVTWKQCLLKWINQVDILGRPCRDLKDANIEVFFENFKTKIDIDADCLQTFYKRQYEKLLFEYKNENLCVEEYMFGYSALLHFSCVVDGNRHFVVACQNVGFDCSTMIANFLKQMMKSTVFDLVAIHSAILLSVQPSQEVEKTMSQLCSETPKTKTLNAFNSENGTLKARLIGEQEERWQYEKENEELRDRCQRLLLERDKLKKELDIVKSQISEENIAPKEGIDQKLLKDRHLKEICNKDETIIELQQQIDDLSDSNKQLSQKLVYIQSEFNKSIESTNCLSLRLTLCNDEMEKSQEIVKQLQLIIEDYHKHFESNKKSKSLDNSFVQAMAIQQNTSISAAENLGSIVELQLREQLTAKINEHKELSEKMDDLIETHNLEIADLEARFKLAKAADTDTQESLRKQAVQLQNEIQEYELFAATVQSQKYPVMRERNRRSVDALGLLQKRLVQAQSNLLLVESCLCNCSDVASHEELRAVVAQVTEIRDTLLSKSDDGTISEMQAKLRVLRLKIPRAGYLMVFLTRINGKRLYEMFERDMTTECQKLMFGLTGEIAEKMKNLCAIYKSKNMRRCPKLLLDNNLTCSVASPMKRSD